jgi:acyl-CoA thioester hydrolase
VQKRPDDARKSQKAQGNGRLGFATVNFGQPTDRKPPFKYSALTRVGFSDTDAQGIVYYGRYLPYFDDARVEYLRHLGLLDADLAAGEFVMRASHVLYEAPARFDDLIEVFVRTKRIGRSSVTCEYAAYRVDDDALMCTAEQTLVLVDLAERGPHPVPDGYRETVAAFEGADMELAVPS